MTTLADISDLLAKVLGSSIGPIPFYAFPALVLGIGVAVWFLNAHVKKEVVIDASKHSTLLTAEQWLQENTAGNKGDVGFEPTKYEGYEGLQTEGNNGKADLEERLIGALAQAPWKVKEGSEIALAKNDSNKWGIVTNKIVFVLGGNQEHVNATPQVSSPQEHASTPTPPQEEAEEGAV